MNFRVSIQVMPLTNLLDPQGKAVNATLHNMGLHAIQNVRIGREIHMQVEADNKSEAEKMVTEACEKLLHNAVMEQYQFQIEEN